MERTRVADMAERHCGKLSKGYRQRVGLAQALLNNPEVLILDEPTAGLDPKQIIETRKLIKDLAGDHTVVLSTHILPEVSQTCQRVVIINKGKVVAVDTPDNLTSRLRGSESLFLQVDARGADAGASSARLDGVTGVTVTETQDGLTALEVASQTGRDIRRELAAAVVNRGWGLLELRPMRMSLEDVFLTLTTDRSRRAGRAGADARRPHEQRAGHRPQGAEGLLRVADRLHRAGLLRADVRLLLLLAAALSSIARACRGGADASTSTSS